MEDKIMAHMQHQITHNRAAKYSERLTSSLVSLKKERVSAAFLDMTVKMLLVTITS